MWQELCWSTSGVLTSREGGAEATGAMHWAVFKKEEEEEWSGAGNENRTPHSPPPGPESNLY